MEIIQRVLLFLLYAFEIWVLSYFIIVIIFVIIDILKIKTSPRFNYRDPQQKNYSFAAIITLHQDIKFLGPIVDSLLKQKYPNLKIFVVADDCPVIDLRFPDNRVTIIYPPVALHSKIKSLQLALDHIPETAFDAIAIFDPDNLIHPDFFTVMNAYFNHGYKAVQSNILPKNFDSSFARLDALNDQYYNFNDRWMPSQINFCVHIGGRGTIVDLKLYKSISYTNFLGGFDKKLQCDLARKTITGYATDAKLYDEKVSSGDNMQHQRTRWINTYFKYFNESWKVFTEGFGRANFKLIFFGYNNMRPPLFIQLLLVFVVILINIFFFPQYLPALTIIFGLYALSFLYIIKKAFSFSTCVKMLFQIPLFFVRQIRALLGVKKANKQFMQTNNFQVIYIDDVLQKNTL